MAFPRRDLLKPAGCSLLLLGVLATSLPAAVFDYEADSKEARQYDKMAYRLWLPDDLGEKPVRGLLVLVPGINGDGRGQATNKGWQKLAREFDFGTLGLCMKSGPPYYHEAHRGSGEVLLQALEHFAEETEREELENAPLAMWGHSAGGQFNYNFACLEPKRVITYVVNKGGYYAGKIKGDAEDIPAVYFMGETDSAERRKNIRALFEEARDEDAPVCLIVEKGVGHGVGKTRSFAEAYFRTVIPLRLPEEGGLGSRGKKVKLRKLEEKDGWLGDNKSFEIAPYGSYREDKDEASWLPNEDLAKKWQAMNKGG
ncbi:MAG: hypothetical protein AAGK14_01880 [Verrucomicrobiota bacterium]